MCVRSLSHTCTLCMPLKITIMFSFLNQLALVGWDHTGNEWDIGAVTLPCKAPPFRKKHNHAWFPTGSRYLFAGNCITVRLDSGEWNWPDQHVVIYEGTFLACTVCLGCNLKCRFRYINPKCWTHSYHLQHFRVLIWNREREIIMHKNDIWNQLRKMCIHWSTAELGLYLNFYFRSTDLRRFNCRFA